MTQPAPSSATYGGVDVPANAWGLDAAYAGALTDAQMAALAAFDLGTLKVQGYPATGRPVVLWFYVPYSGAAASHWDASADVLKRWCDHGGLAGLVQHPRGGMWTASQALGDADGASAAAFATSIGYPADCYLALDDEAVRNPGPEAFAHVSAWCDRYRQAGKPAIYEGFSPGLTPAQEYEVPTADRYWGAMGPWNVSTRGVCCRQGPTVRIGGVAYDLDRFFPDQLGGALRLMGRVDLWPANAPAIPIPDTAHADTIPPPAGG